jgi:hypothetical protein
VPWCDGCDRFWNPNSLPEDGACPVCGRVVSAPERRLQTGATATLVDDQETKAPWHFKLLVVAITGYLGWRAVQGVEWLIHQL